MLRDLQATQIGVEDFEADEMPFDPTSAEDLVQGGNFRLATRLGSLDIMQWIPGVPGDDAYATLAPEAMVVDLGALRIPVCGLHHLRAMKRAAGRPQDLQDLADLAIAHDDDL